MPRIARISRARCARSLTWTSNRMVDWSPCEESTLTWLMLLCCGDLGRDLRQDAHAVRHLDREPGGEQPLLVLLPHRGDPLVRLLAEGGDVRAVLAVDDDAAAAREVGHDRVVGNREAAARVADDQALGSRDRQRLLRGLRALVVGRQQAARDQAREPLAEADLLEQLRAVLERERAGDLVEAPLRELLDRQLEFLQRRGADLETFDAIDVVTDTWTARKGRGIASGELGFDDAIGRIEIDAPDRHGRGARNAD